MLLHSTRAALNIVSVEHCKAQIARIKEPTTYTDRMLLPIYKEIVRDYERQQKAVVRNIKNARSKS